jgi:hypothetical protein
MAVANSQKEVSGRMGVLSKTTWYTEKAISSAETIEEEKYRYIGVMVL